MIRVSALNAYPIKSCRGVALDAAEVGLTGFVQDRQWLLVDEAGRFMTQRDWPMLARIEVAIDSRGLEVVADGMPRLAVHDPGARAEQLEVVIWRDECVAVTAGAVAAAWFTDFLGTPCRLVKMPPSTIRQVNQKYAEPGDRVGFADGYPFLMISQGSLDELNRRLETPIPMNRFRPNIVVEGCEPHAEDGWSRMTAGNVRFRVVKPCSRCVVTTTDQATGERGPEPLRTLATYRRVGSKVLFGQNLIHDDTGIIRVGDTCTVEPAAER